MQPGRLWSGNHPGGGGGRARLFKWADDGQPRGVLRVPVPSMPQLRLHARPRAPRARAGPSRCLGPPEGPPGLGGAGDDRGPLGRHTAIWDTPESVGTTSGFRKLPLTSEDGKCTVSPVRVAKSPPQRWSGTRKGSEVHRGKPQGGTEGSEMKPQGQRRRAAGGAARCSRGGGRYRRGGSWNGSVVPWSCRLRPGPGCPTTARLQVAAVRRRRGPEEHGRFSTGWLLGCVASGRLRLGRAPRPPRHSRRVGKVVVAPLALEARSRVGSSNGHSPGAGPHRPPPGLPRASGVRQHQWAERARTRSTGSRRGRRARRTPLPPHDGQAQLVEIEVTAWTEQDVDGARRMR